MIIFLLLDRIFRLYEESFYQLKMEAYNINDLIIILSNNEFNELSTRIASANRLTIELQNGLGCIISNLLRNTFLSKDIKKRLNNLFYMAKKFKNRIKLIKNFFRIVHLIHIAKVSLNNLKSSRELELIIRKLTAINVMFLLPVHTHGTFGMNVRDPGMIGMPDTPSGYQWFIGIMCFVGAYFF
jgi:Mg2+ and Co2+ transporter CorA